MTASKKTKREYFYFQKNSSLQKKDNKVQTVLFAYLLFHVFIKSNQNNDANRKHTGKMIPIAGGQEETGVIERLISFLLISLARTINVYAPDELLPIFDEVPANCLHYSTNHS